MATIEVKLPKMGESIKEATILNWLKKVGDSVEQGEAILEVATDKVDSEVAAPESGILTEVLVELNEVVEIGKLIARIDQSSGQEKANSKVSGGKEVEHSNNQNASKSTISNSQRFDDEGRFYSPLVRSMAKKEGVSFDQLQEIKGSGQNGRLLKRPSATTKPHHASTGRKNWLATFIYRKN